MKLLYHPIFLAHDTGEHPENKNRLSAFSQIEPAVFEDGSAYLSLVHTPEYIELVKDRSAKSLPLDQDTLTSRRSFEVACHGVGMALAAAKTGDFALIRPPGHHAYPTYGSGFCLFNNLAVAVQQSVSQGKRVLILDFDGHCGDGTEHIFYQSDQVLFWSLHQSPAFPGKGFVHEIGSGGGVGYTINVELPPGTGDDLFLQAMDRLLPLAKQFNPDLVALSAGFDAHQADPLLQLRLSLNTYYYLGQLIRKEFSQVFAVLEGGYNLEELPKCIFNFVDGFNGKTQRYKESSTTSGIQVRQSFDAKLSQLETNLSPYW